MAQKDEQRLGESVRIGSSTVLISALIFVSALLVIRAELAENQPQTYIFKATTMLLIMVVAWSALEPPASIYKRLIIVGLAISLLGDVLLMVPYDLFLPGLVAFLIAQIVYTAAFIKVGGFYRSIVGALPFLAYGLLILYFLGPDLDDMLAPVLFYLVAILTMIWQAFGQWRQTGSTRALLAFTGAAFFVVSDTALAFNRFGAAIELAPLIILGTYFLAQWLIALSAGAEHH